MFALSMFELMRAIWIVRKYSDDCDLDEAFTRMSLRDFWMLRTRVVSACGLWMTA